MLFLKRTSALATAAITALTLGQGVSIAPSQAVDLMDVVTIHDLARDAYIWGLAPEFVYRFSHYQELVSAPVNTLKYGNNEAGWNNNATNAGDASVVYINAFVDFNEIPDGRMILTVPPSDGQYYVVNYLDAFVNGIGSIGNRTTPSDTTMSYVLVSPTDPAAGDATVSLGDQIYPVLSTDSNLNWLLVRVRANSLTDPADPESMASVKTNVVQKFALNTVSQFVNNSYQPVYPDNYDDMIPTSDQIREAQQWQSAPTTAVDFFDQVGDGLVYSPLPVANTAMNGTLMANLPPQYIPQNGATDTYFMPSYDQQSTLARFAPIGLTAAGFTVPSGWGAEQRAALESGFNDGVTFLQSLASAGTAKASTNYWSYLNNVIGTYPNTVKGYIARGIVVLDGGSANVPLDAIYPQMNSNDGSTQLDGNNTYSITFTPPESSYSTYPVTGIYPPMVKQDGKVAGFWSLVVYQPDSTSSSAPFIPQTSVLNTSYSDPTSTAVNSVSGNTLTVNAPAWGPIDLSTPLVFGANAADYGLRPGVVYYVATQPVQPTATTYSFQVSTSWLQELSPGNVPIQQTASVGGAAGPIVPLTAGTSPLTFGPVQPVSQLGSDQLNAGDLQLNADGSVTLWLAPTLPAGASASNWIPTPNTAYYQSVYGASSNVSTGIQAMIRMYYPTPGNQPPSLLPLNSGTSTTYVLPPLVKVNTSSDGTVVAPGVTLVNEQTAQATAPRTMKAAPSNKIGSAPMAKAKTAEPIALQLQKLFSGRTYEIKIKVNGTYSSLGFSRADAQGGLALPVVRIRKAGVYTIAIVDFTTNVASYIKVKVTKPPTR